MRVCLRGELIDLEKRVVDVGLENIAARTARHRPALRPLAFKQPRSCSPLLTRRRTRDRQLEQRLGRRQLDDDTGARFTLALPVRTLATG